MKGRDHRSQQAANYRHLYNTTRWKGKHGVRARQLTAHPLCEMCLKANKVTAATVCDHVDPTSKATEAGFFAGPFQSLCQPHHDSTKQRAEARGYVVGCDAKGRPLDPNHLWNRPKVG